MESYILDIWLLSHTKANKKLSKNSLDNLKFKNCFVLN